MVNGDDETMEHARFICSLCYLRGEFRARCRLCNASEKCAPWLTGSSEYVCVACQWRGDGGGVAADDAAKTKSIRR